jgi:hypothetical protein
MDDGIVNLQIRMPGLETSSDFHMNRVIAPE